MVRLISEHILAKNRMVNIRGGRVYATCDHCNKRLFNRCEKDELLHRSASSKKAKSGDLLLSEHLSALVCPECHWKHHNSADIGFSLQGYRDTCFRKLYEIYGVETIVAAFNTLSDELKYELGYVLPKPKGKKR